MIVKMFFVALPLLVSGCISDIRGRNSYPADRIGSNVLSRMCGLGLQSQVGAERVVVDTTTRPILNDSVLIALRIVSGEETTPQDFDTAKREATTLNAAAVALPVDIPRGCPCAFTQSAPRNENEIELQLTSPFRWRTRAGAVNRGIIARLSLNDQAVSWFWLELKDDEPSTITSMIRLPIDD